MGAFLDAHLTEVLLGIILFGGAWAVRRAFSRIDALQTGLNDGLHDIGEVLRLHEGLIAKNTERTSHGMWFDIDRRNE